MTSPDPTWTDVAGVGFLAAQTAVLIAAGLVGLSQLREARDLREAQTRPFVVIDLDSTVRPLFDLVVKNLGRTMATDVRFEFNRTPESAMGIDLSKIKMFSDGIATLPPEKEYRCLFEDGPKRHKRPDLPDMYEVTVRYRDHTGKKPYSETMTLDFGLYWERLEVDRKDIRDIYKQLDGIRQVLGKLTPG